MNTRPTACAAAVALALATACSETILDPAPAARAVAFANITATHVSTTGIDYTRTGPFLEVYAMSNAGHVVGGHITGGLHLAYVWHETTGIVTLPTLGGTDGTALDVNDAGHVVGRSLHASGGPHAVVWKHGVATDLGTLSGDHSEARAINNHGVIVGFSSKVGSAPGRWCGKTARSRSFPRSAAASPTTSATRAS